MKIISNIETTKYFDIPIFSEAKDVLLKLIHAIGELTQEEYNQKFQLLSGGSIGEHTRHIIELFQQLNKGYDSGIINYDKRARDKRLQEDIDFAIEAIAYIIQALAKENKLLELESMYHQNSFPISSSYFRELMYNIEHCIHHQAIIKIALLYLNKSDLDNDFGYAKSTIAFKKNVHGNFLSK